MKRKKDTEFVDECLDMFVRLERMQRSLHEMIKAVLEDAGYHDVTPVQAMMMFVVGRGTASLGEIVIHGDHLSSNTSYNVRRIVGKGYAESWSPENDRRTRVISLTRRGVGVLEAIEDAVRRRAREAAADGGVDLSSLRTARTFLDRMEAVWRNG